MAFSSCWNDKTAHILITNTKHWIRWSGWNFVVEAKKADYKRESAIDSGELKSPRWWDAKIEWLPSDASFHSAQICLNVELRLRQERRKFVFSMSVSGSWHDGFDFQSLNWKFKKIFMKFRRPKVIACSIEIETLCLLLFSRQSQWPGT